MTPADLFLKRLEHRLSGPLWFFLGFCVGFFGYPLISELRRLW
ncbi:MAG: hypothetical protein WC455_31315 [Dehalococcoidia bacterium]|jgi:hypothetical protein